MLRSEVGLFIALNFFLSLHAVAALLTTGVFLGSLSPREAQRLSHRLIKYLVFKVVFVGAVLSPDVLEVTVWLAWFAVVGYLRVFAGAAKDRLELLVVSPAASAWQHARAVALLLLVLLHDGLALHQVLRMLGRMTATKVLLCGFDAVVIVVEGAKTLTRYGVHMSDRLSHLPASQPAAGGDAPEGPQLDAAAEEEEEEAAGGAAAHAAGPWAGWEAKGSFLYHAELMADVLVHLLTLAHYVHVWALHGLSFHLIDAILLLDIRAVALSMLRRIRGYVNYRAATRCLEGAFRDFRPGPAPAPGPAAAAEKHHPLHAHAHHHHGAEHEHHGHSHGAECTICMDSIHHVGKLLPCGHVFHLACLRAWLQQSGSDNFTCPNCRKPILVGGPHGGGTAAGGRGGGAAVRLVAAVERLHERALAAVEPPLLRLLHRLGHWLAPPDRPMGHGEAMGESPDPPPAAAGGSRRPQRWLGRSSRGTPTYDDDGSGNEDEFDEYYDDASDDDYSHLYYESDDYGQEGRAATSGGGHPGGASYGDSGEDFGEDGGHDGIRGFHRHGGPADDSHVGGGRPTGSGAAAASGEPSCSQSQSASRGAAAPSGSRGTHGGDGGGGRPTRRHGSAAAAAALAAGQRLRHGHATGRATGLHLGMRFSSTRLVDLEALAAGEQHGVGEGGGVGVAGAVRPEGVPSWSGHAAVAGVAALARAASSLGVVYSLRTSVATAGAAAGAVAGWTGDGEDGEVASARRMRRKPAGGGGSALRAARGPGDQGAEVAAAAAAAAAHGAPADGGVLRGSGARQARSGGTLRSRAAQVLETGNDDSDANF